MYVHMHCKTVTLITKLLVYGMLSEGSNCIQTRVINGRVTDMECHFCRSWTRLGLPVCLHQLAKSCDHLCGLVCRYVSLCLGEASQLNGILLSIKCMRTTKVSEI